VHYQGIIHRDIKPANLLWTEDHKLVKISDFGVSHVSDALDRATPGGGSGADDKALRKTAGSPAFFAPELCHSADTTSTPDPSKVDNYFSSDDHIVRPQLSAITAIHQPNTFPVIISPPNPDSTSSQHHRPPIGKGIDVWALGITLYCLLFGDTPFMARTEYELYNVIVRESIEIPEQMGRERAWTGVGKGWLGCGDGVEGREVVNLLSGLLEKDPAKRISLEEVKVGLFSTTCFSALYCIEVCSCRSLSTT
jgi:serine/threonine protein kinase